jgi:uncharacterized protein YbjQ (UPF0145 family)
MSTSNQEIPLKDWTCTCTAINPSSETTCWNCKNTKSESEQQFIQGTSKQLLSQQEFETSKSEEMAEISKVQVVSIPILPPNANYKLIKIVGFQSTLGTGFFSEFGSDISNIFGTEVNMMNNKMSLSRDKCIDAMKRLAWECGGNAVIDVSFEFTTNTRDATTVAASGTAVFIENISEIFM